MVQTNSIDYKHNHTRIDYVWFWLISIALFSFTLNVFCTAFSPGTNPMIQYALQAKMRLKLHGNNKCACTSIFNISHLKHSDVCVFLVNAAQYIQWVLPKAKLFICCSFLLLYISFMLFTLVLWPFRENSKTVLFYQYPVCGLFSSLALFIVITKVHTIH